MISVTEMFDSSTYYYYVLFPSYLGMLIEIPLMNVPLKYNRLVSPTRLDCIYDIMSTPSPDRLRRTVPGFKTSVERSCELGLPARKYPALH